MLSHSGFFFFFMTYLFKCFKRSCRFNARPCMDINIQKTFYYLMLQVSITGTNSLELPCCFYLWKKRTHHLRQDSNPLPMHFSLYLRWGDSLFLTKWNTENFCVFNVSYSQVTKLLLRLVSGHLVLCEGNKAVIMVPAVWKILLWIKCLFPRI